VFRRGKLIIIIEGVRIPVLCMVDSLSTVDNTYEYIHTYVIVCQRGRLGVGNRNAGAEGWRRPLKAAECA